MSAAALGRTLARVPAGDRAAVALAALAVAAAAAAAVLRVPPAPLVAAAALAVLAPLLAPPLRRLGLEGLWLCLLAGAVLAGELSSLSLGGQNGRILWADAWLVLGLIVLLARGRLALEVPRAGFLTALLPFLVWSAVGLPFARDPLTGIAELKEWLAAAAAGLCAARWALDARRARVLLAAVALTGAALAALMALSAWRSPLGLELAVLTKQVDLPWGRSNYLAGLLVLAFPVALGLMGSVARAAARAFWLAIALAIAAGVALSASKGAVLALALGCAAVFLGPASARSSRAPRLALLAASALVAAVFLAGPLRDALDYRLGARALASSTSERRVLYRLALEQGLRHPLLGLGLNNFSVVSYSLHGRDTVPHNLVLGFFAETGVIGLFLVLAWGGALIASARRALRVAATRGNRSLALGGAAALFAVTLHNLVESTLYGEQFKLLLFLVAAALWRLARAERTPPEGAPAPEPCASHGAARPARAGR